MEPHEIEELINAMDTLSTVNEEPVPVWESMGRVLSRDVVVPMDIPPRPKAAYDGYAVRSRDIFKAPARLRLVGSVRIGEVPSIKVGPHGDCYVTTGAYLPVGADAVVPEEFVDVTGNNEVVINKSVKPWENVDPAGDFARRGGDVVLREGTVIMPWDIPALLELGIGEVWVRRRVRLFVVATGSELIETKAPGEVLDAVINGKVVESTASFIGNYVRMYIPYAEVVGRTIVPDDQEAIRNTVMKALDLADIVITTGGTGPSGVDYVYEVTKSLNQEYTLGGVKDETRQANGLGSIG
ncbi:molybdopterin-binding protein [Vulcanisaeta souniana]|uniref:molybdopterin-binding protein n=1 Tax=Vulcanisaeta souniana TaxID=164452 RepID=UPI0006CFC96C|nr:molybdopterin-binding protein [Vulcanisaeta souniana]